MQWNVRSTLAACIHDIARTIGRTATEKHLVPVYRDLMRDWTQVTWPCRKQRRVALFV